MNYTDQQLQLALAKMLPTKLLLIKRGEFSPLQEGIQLSKSYDWIFFIDQNREICDTEWLHVCWLVEQRLSVYTGEHGQEYSQCDNYAKELMKLCGTWKSPDWNWGSVCDADLFKAANATWQQRAIALAKVKGVVIE